AIADALKISLYGQQEPATQIMNYLKRKDILLILDNFEHLLEGVGLLTDLIAHIPHLKLLVTSRERLNVQEEWVLPIDGLAYPSGEAVAEIESYSEVQLFTQRACRVQPSFSLLEEKSAVIAICSAVGGMPLGIELAASWLRVIPCKQIARQIELDFD